jgi:hypothetical protein
MNPRQFYWLVYGKITCGESVRELLLEYYLENKEGENWHTFVYYVVYHTDKRTSCPLLKSMHDAGILDTSHALKHAWNLEKRSAFAQLLTYGVKFDTLLAEISGGHSKCQAEMLEILHKHIDKQTKKAACVVLLSRRIQAHVGLHRDTARLIARMILEKNCFFLILVFFLLNCGIVSLWHNMSSYVRCEDCVFRDKRSRAATSNCTDCGKPICYNCIVDKDRSDDEEGWCEQCDYAIKSW